MQSISLFTGDFITQHNSFSTSMYKTDVLNRRGLTLHKKTVTKDFIDIKIMKQLNELYLEPLQNTCKRQNMSSVILLDKILMELDTYNPRRQYDREMQNIFKSLTVLIHKVQQYYFEILIGKKRLKDAKDEIKKRETRIGDLEKKLSKYTGLSHVPGTLSGSYSIKAVELPNTMYLLLHIDIVRAWYYYMHGEPKGCNILDNEKLLGIYSHLSTFRSLQEAKNTLRSLLDEKYKSS